MRLYGICSLRSGPKGPGICSLRSGSKGPGICKSKDLTLSVLVLKESTSMFRVVDTFIIFNKISHLATRQHSFELINSSYKI
jgi:hypothetical protein